MTVLTLHVSSNDPWFTEVQRALAGDPDSLRMFVTVEDTQTVFKPRNISIESPALYSMNPFQDGRIPPATATVELWPV